MDTSNMKELLPLLKERRSEFSFSLNKVVTSELIEKLLEAARWAPSSYNEQPWSFLVVNRHQNSVAWEKMLNCIVPANRVWAERAPVFIVVGAAKKFKLDNGENFHAEYDVGAATFALMIEAYSLGLASHQMGGFQSPMVRGSFQVPDAITLLSILAIGYPGNNTDTLPESICERIKAPRTRKKMNEFCFEGQWGKGIPFD